MFTRHVNRSCTYAEAAPHMGWEKGYMQRGGTPTLTLQVSPMMKLGQGWIPAALDPSDPKTWTVPVVFTR